MKKIIYRLLIAFQIGILTLFALYSLSGCSRSSEPAAKKAAENFLNFVCTIEEPEKILSESELFDNSVKSVEKYKSNMTDDAYNTFIVLRFPLQTYIVTALTQSSMEAGDISLRLIGKDEEKDLYSYNFTSSTTLTSKETGDKFSLPVEGSITMEKFNGQWRVFYISIGSKEWFGHYKTVLSKYM